MQGNHDINRQSEFVEVGPPLRTRTQRCVSSDPEFGGGAPSTPSLGCSAICPELHGGAILSMCHTRRVDFRRERIPAPTLLEGAKRDEGPHRSWNYDFREKSRPVQSGVHLGCAARSTRDFTEHEVSWTRLPSWYGPRIVVGNTTF